METIDQAKRQLREYRFVGTNCPCCGQRVKFNPRTIYQAPALALINLYRMNQKKPGFYHMRDIGTPKSGGGDFSKLKYWGLIEPGQNDDPTKSSSGYWGITPKGIDFVENRIKVPRKCYVYNKKPREWDVDQVSIVDCLADQAFRYNEFMGYLI